MMFAPSEDQQPVMYLRGYPVHAAHFLVLLFVSSMLVTTVVMAAGGTAALSAFTFVTEAVYSGQLWRIFTAGLVNAPSIGFVVDMFILVWFGRELEKFFGRKIFLRFYAALYLLTPVLFTLLGFIRPVGFAGVTGTLAVFVGFATLYPNAALLFGVLAKWMAAIIVGILTLIHLSVQDIVSLISLWATTGFAFGFVRWQQGRFDFPEIRLPLPIRRPKLRVLPKPAEGRDTPAGPPDAAMAELDALLDKIATSGLASLTPGERERLEKAREDLLKRESPRP
jgi:membrane associated rhomboid family serine protease